MDEDITGGSVSIYEQITVNEDMEAEKKVVNKLLRKEVKRP